MNLDSRIRSKLRLLSKIPRRISWEPFSGPQTIAYYSPANEIFFGGSPGGGKSDLLLGLALTAHSRSLILRRRASDLEAIQARLQELTGLLTKQSFRLGKRFIELGGCLHESSKGKYQGRAHDLKGFDEITQFSQSQYEFIKVWNRSASGAHCRTFCTFNPPLSQDGRWVLDYLAPWLDKRHPNPAQSGEVRWFARAQEVDSSDPVDLDGERILPVSRCFIFSETSDNPLLALTGYDRLLDNLPPELRGLMDFSGSIKDDPFQVCPSAWVEAAQERYRRLEPSYFAKTPQDAIGVDVARGGIDRLVFAFRHASAIRLRDFAGKHVPDGPAVLGYLIPERRGNPPIFIDLIGVGTSPHDFLVHHNFPVIAVVGSEASYARTRCGKFGFYNKRSELHWKFREALDPAYGSDLAIEASDRMSDRGRLCDLVFSDLTAPRWTLTHRGILVESKADIAKRLGRSTDYGDAIIMACDLQSLAYSPSF